MSEPRRHVNLPPVVVDDECLYGMVDEDGSVTGSITIKPVHEGDPPISDLVDLRIAIETGWLD